MEEVTEEEEDEGKKDVKGNGDGKASGSRRGLLSVGTCKKKLSGCCSIVILLCKDTSKIICIHTDTYHMISYKS